VITENAGLAAVELLAKLHTAHLKRGSERYFFQRIDEFDGWQFGSVGIDVERGDVGDMNALGVWEPAAVKEHQYWLATEAACLILTSDWVFRLPKSETEEERSERTAKETHRQEAIQRRMKALLQRFVISLFSKSSDNSQKRGVNCSCRQ
jgi:chaperonin GroEL (HSP60 family)